MTSESALPSRHLMSFTLLSIFSLLIIRLFFPGIVTCTQRYFTVLTDLIPSIYGRSSWVRISDFLFLSRRIQLVLIVASFSMTFSTSAFELDITSMSSAKASKSPLLIMSSNFFEDLSASSRLRRKELEKGLSLALVPSQRSCSGCYL